MLDAGTGRPPTGGRRLVVICGLIELTSWAALYYAVPLVMDPVARDTGWSLTGLTAGYSGSLVLAALLSPWVGTVVDRRGPRHLVTGGVLIGGLGLVVAGTAQQPAVGLTAMAMLGIGQAATLYPPVFAALTIWFGDRAAAAVMVVSLFGGASSALLAPVLAPLVEAYGWRDALLWVAIVYVVTTGPLAWCGLSAPWQQPVARSTEQDVGQIVRSRRFRAAQLSLLLAGVALFAVTLNLVPLARELGHSYGTAAVAFGLVGVGQIVGRLLYLPLGRIGDPTRRTMVLVAAAATVVAGLAVAPGIAGLIVAAMLAGAVRGMHTLNVTLGVADRWGRVAFGELSGRFHRPVGLAIALAPFAGALLAGALGGFQAAALALAVVTIAGVVIARAS